MKDTSADNQNDPWAWAAARLTRWGKPQQDDCDFRSWMIGASEDLLNAGCLYEYARESHKFRCLLALDRRKRGQFSGVWIEFERSSGGFTWLTNSGWGTWLHDFADELVANKSFAEVLRTDQHKVHKSLKRLRGYSLYPKAVESPGRYINVPGMQEITIQIDWRHFNNREIGAEMERFAKLNRPEREPKPDRRGKKGKSRIRADLKALSVMRIRKHYSDPWKRLKLVAEFCGYKVCKDEWAEHKVRRDRFLPKEPMSNKARAKMSRMRKRALDFFQLLFPWGKPTNC